MGKAAEKIRELEFDEITTISVIESDPDVSEIVKDDLKISLNLLRKMSIEGHIKPETKLFLRNIFDKIILTKSDLIEKYLRLSSNSEKPNVIEELEVKIPNKKTTKTRTIPRRYGKEKILKDIEKQDGKATPLQKAMLELNVMKNITVNLNTRCIKDLFSESNILTHEDCRDIVAVVKIAKQKLKTILDKK